MNFKEQLINKNIIDSEDIVQIDAKLNKLSKKLTLDILFKNTYPIEKYNEIRMAIKDILSNFSFGYYLNIRYENYTLNEMELENYFKEIIEALKESSLKYSAFLDSNKRIEGNRIVFKFESDALGFDSLLPTIKKEFLSYGLNVNLDIELDYENNIEAQINKIDKKIEETFISNQKEAEAIVDFNKNSKEARNKYKAIRPQRSFIKDIPMSFEALVIQKNTEGPQNILVEGRVFGIDIRKFSKSKSAGLAQIKITDDTDSIVCKYWLKTEEELSLYENSIVNDTILRVIGQAEFDTFSKNVVISARTIEVIGKYKNEIDVEDLEPVKRVELHLHSKMTTLDGVNEVKDYYKLANKWGHKAMAITDLYGVYALADLEHAIDNPDFKPIYGCELGYVDNLDPYNYNIAFNEYDSDLKDSTYVVFDIETTGFSQTSDKIIEIAAHKVRNGDVIDSFETFINPMCHISEKITNLTSITDDDVKDADTIDIVLPKFLEFAKGCILVAHNAKFDVGHIYANCERLNINHEDFLVIDTLNLFRVLHQNDVKQFNLKELCKVYNIKQEHHHRAIDDTRVTALCFIIMLSEIYSKGVYNYKDLNSLIDDNTHFRHLFPYKICLLAKNKAGKKNMYKIVSDALTTHLWRGKAITLTTVINELRENVLVGDSAGNSIIFETVLNRSEKEARRLIEFFDYIEIMPLSGYSHLWSIPTKEIDGGIDKVKETIIKIINLCKEMNKLVVAVGDCYYLRPENKKIRNILINTPQIGGGIHELINAKEMPNKHFRSTTEMLNEMEFLGKDLAYEVTVTNTNLIADMIEKYPVFEDTTFAPRDDQFKDSFLHIPSINEEAKRIVNLHIKDTYGDNPHPIVKNRIEREMNAIIKSGYMSVYYVSHLLVTQSLKDGYLVGSRGSVGSSFCATMMDITEVNPLKPHYRCPCCKFHTFQMTSDELNEYGLSDLEKPFQEVLQSVFDGFDLPDMDCPVCGQKLIKDGHDIPFETFLGFKGDKTPDIDLNFSGEYQSKAHEYIRKAFGNDYAFRAGTVQSIAENTGFGYVKGYCERQHITLRDCEIERLASMLDGIKRSTGQHPGGIVAVPNYIDIFDVTPYQFPADKLDSDWRTTHFDYHKFEKNLLKFDILGHDDPTIIKYLMDYVHLHQENYPFTKPQDIPISDKNLYKLFSSTEIIGVDPDELGTSLASYGVPEFGTNFVQKMLLETKPSTFAQLIKISGLSHGTDVWNTNAQDLVNGTTEYGKVEFKDIIGCRDDIMVDLIRFGLDPKMAFDIMEFVRKGKKHSGDPKAEEKWKSFVGEMEARNVKPWYIYSCSKIKYMFPKAHAIAYVMMALRIAWFKVYSKELFYSAWLSKRAKGHDVDALLSGPLGIRNKIQELNATDRSATDDGLLTSLQVALECSLRGIKFLPVDINKSSATVFEIEDGNLRIPFSAVDKLGEAVANDIVNKRNEKPFTSIMDVCKRTRLNQSLVEDFKNRGFFGDLPEEDLEINEGLFAL